VLTHEKNERLTRVGPGTPMGELLRRYWHPIAAASEFATGKFPLKRRLLGEDLVVFRTADGAYGAMEPVCPHRGASLEFGSVEDSGLRCAYHGWKFAPSGKCLEQPVEPGGGGKGAATTKAYPAEELGGLVWVYMGPSPAPLIPHYDLFVWNDCLREIGQVRLPCNFVQIMENSVDPHHVEWLHGRFAAYARGDGATALFTQHAVKIGFDNFEYGIIKRRLVEGQTEDSDSWKIGHPLVFPNMLRVGGGGSNQMQIRVPIDDTATQIYYYTSYRAENGKKPRPQSEIPLYEIPLRHPDGSYALDVTDVQDLVMWASQGPIVDRTKERLGRSDVGVAQLRKLYFSEMEKVEQGQDPLAVVRDPAKNHCIDLPQEHHTYGSGGGFLQTVLVAGQSRFSPLLPDVLELFDVELNPA
jgi:5,5'-dehydrodivanillate O-demethylase oxygenase subunit